MLNGKYQIIKSLGQGGSGEVSLALDKSSDREVAIKMIPLESGFGPESIENEIAALKKINHPGVVEYIDSFSVDDTFYVVTEYLTGETLEQIISNRQLTPDDIANYTNQILSALGHIHSLGIIHSDLKPDNIIIDNEGQLRLIDFGIVRTASAEIAADIKEIRGTLYYMSPEQADGQPFDVRSDLFSLGVILYQLWTGRKPFEGEYDMAIIYAILYEDPVPPDKLCDNMPSGLSDVIMNLLAKEADKRPASAGTLERLIASLATDKSDNKDKGEPRLAIIPLVYPEDDDDSRLISEGLTDELHGRLKEIGGLKLVSSIRVAKHLEKLDDGPAVRSLLGADYYLTGKVRRFAQNIRIEINIKSSKDDAKLWSDSFDGSLDNLFDIMDDIIGEVTSRFRSHIKRADGKAASISTTTFPEAYELYLLARSYYVKNSKDDIEYARNMYHQALKIDPDYALAKVGVADCYCMDYMDYHNRLEETISTAIEWAKQALVNFPNLPEAYRALGRIMHATGKLDEAAEYYLKAVTYKEDYYLAYRSLGWVNLDLYRPDEALRWVRKSLSINSTDIETVLLKGLIYSDLKKSKQAINQFTRCLELRPDYGRAMYYQGVTFIQLGWVDKAIWSLVMADRVGGDINIPYQLGYYYIVANNFEDAISTLEKAVLLSEIAFLARFYIGLAYLLQGNRDEAMVEMEKSAELCEKLIKSDPDFYFGKLVLIKAQAFLGKEDETLKLIDELAQQAEYDGAVSLEIGQAFAILGDSDKATEYLKKSLDCVRGATINEMKIDPILMTYYDRIDELIKYISIGEAKVA